MTSRSVYAARPWPAVCVTRAATPPRNVGGPRRCLGGGGGGGGRPGPLVELFPVYGGVVSSGADFVPHITLGQASGYRAARARPPDTDPPPPSPFPVPFRPYSGSAAASRFRPRWYRPRFLTRIRRPLGPRSGTAAPRLSAPPRPSR